MSVMEPSLWAWAAETGLGFAGFGACLLFLREAQRGGTLPGCGPMSGCEAVAASRWARVGPWPVAALGLVLYSALTLAALARLVAVVECIAHAVQITAVTAAGGAALWFTLVQLVVLRRVCKFCMIFHGIGAVLCVVIWWENQAPAHAEIAVGAAGLLAMILWQVLFPSKTYAIISMANVATSDGNAGSDTSSGPPRPSDRPGDGKIVLLGGRLRVAQADWPLLGAPEARHHVALLFDITCDDCRALYQLLLRAVAERPQELAVTLIPVPLDPACNPAIARMLGEKDACDHARLFLAVWQTDRTAFAEYSTWLLNSPRCPSFQDARSKMHRQLGTPLSLALTAGSLDLHIQKAVGLYRQSTAQKLPQLLLAEQLVVGRMTAINDLWDALESVS